MAANGTRTNANENNGLIRVRSRSFAAEVDPLTASHGRGPEACDPSRDRKGREKRRSRAKTPSTPRKTALFALRSLRLGAKSFGRFDFVHGFKRSAFRA
jgi:hypothetical protein